MLYSPLYGLATVELRGTEYEELGTSPLLACAPGECTQAAVSIAHCPARYECQPRDKDRAKQGCGQKVRVGQTTESDACWIRLRQFDQGPATDRWIVGSLPPLRREKTDGSAKEIMQGGRQRARQECRNVQSCVCVYTCVPVCLVDGEIIDTVLYWARGQIKVLYDGYL